MTESTKQKFLILYLVPPAVIADWKATDAEKRRPAEQKMQADWQKWMSDHASMILSTDVGGKTKRVTPDGVADVENEITLFSMIEAESHEAATKAFEGHPHLGIPQASIEIMAVREMGGM